MKKIVALLGLTTGVATAIFALLFNPMSSGYAGSNINQNVYNWTALEFQGVVLNAANMLGLRSSAMSQPIAGDGLKVANASIVVLRDGTGQAQAMATRLITLDDNADLLSGSLGARTYTNIFWPNHGSLLMQGDENRWPVVRADVMSALGQPAERLWLVSAVNKGRVPPGIVGGSGQFEGIGGSYGEYLQFSPDGDGSLNGQIALELSFR